MSIAFLFPGQGSQVVGMGQELAERYPVVADTIAEAERLSGIPIATLCNAGPTEVLQQTQNAQLALLTISTAIARLLAQRGLTPQFAAGHSLGEYSALVAARAISFEAAIALVKRRGELMAAAGELEPGTMAAILGFDATQLNALCQAAPGVVAIANYNSAEQLVISGARDAVAAVCKAALVQGAKRAIPLNVSGAFHSPLMRSSAAAFAPALSATSFEMPVIPVIANVDAIPYHASLETPLKLAKQLDHPVLWQQSMQYLLDAGVTAFVEVGPGRVLSGLVKKMRRDAVTLNVEDEASLVKTLSTLEVAS